VRAGGVALLALALLACGDGGPPAAVGTLERDRIELVAEASEPVVERPVREGERVKAGARILLLDPARYDARIDRAESARARAAARLAELVRGPRQERIAAARARLAGAEGTLVTARRDLERSRELFDQRVESKGRLDARAAAFQQARASRDAALADLEAMLEGTTSEELAQARAALDEAKAALEELRIQAARLDVRAPSDGIVDALLYYEGERPPPGAVVAVLLRDQAPYARVYVPESLRARVRPGVEAQVRIDGVPGALRGRVRNVASDASFTPYYALTERDRGRLVYVAKVDLIDPAAAELPTGLPVEVVFVDVAVAGE
jgi:HlyD family secretion protein